MSQSPAAAAAAAKTKVKKGSGVAKKGKTGAKKQKVATGPIMPTKPNMRKFNRAAGNTTMAKSVQLMGNDLYVHLLQGYARNADNYRHAARGKKVTAAHAKASIEADVHFHLIVAH